MNEIVNSPVTKYLAKKFADHGERIYLVGGAVRDYFLDIPNDDLDYATSAHPEKTMEILSDDTEDVVVFPYDVGIEFGTIGAQIWFKDDDPLKTEMYKVEITTFRAREDYPSWSRKPKVQWGESLEDDMSRRDFTINAIAIDPHQHSVYDMFYGGRDIERKIIRAVGDPNKRFTEDPLRILRAIRFAARLGFKIDWNTRKAMVRHVKSLEKVSIERIREEFIKVLMLDDPSHGLRLFKDNGIFREKMPELSTGAIDLGIGMAPSVPPELTLRLAAFLFSYEFAVPILTKLKFPTDVISEVMTILDGSIAVYNYTVVGSYDWRELDRDVRYIILGTPKGNGYEVQKGRIGELIYKAIALARAASQFGDDRPGMSYQREIDLNDFEDRLKHFGLDNILAIDSPFDGDELMSLFPDRGPGSWIKEVKRVLIEAIKDGRLEVGDRNKALSIVEDRLYTLDRSG